jgi:hypothetical protein
MPQESSFEIYHSKMTVLSCLYSSQIIIVNDFAILISRTAIGRVQNEFKQNTGMRKSPPYFANATVA